MMCRIMLVTLLFLFFGEPGNAQNLGQQDGGIRIAEDTDDIMKACAIGRIISVNADVRAGIQRFLRGAYGNGLASLSDLGGILDRIQPTAEGIEIYKVYVSCLKEQAEIKLRARNINISQQLGVIEDLIRSRPIQWASAGIFSTSVRVGLDLSTIITISDVECPVFVWIEDVYAWNQGAIGTIGLRPPPDSVQENSSTFRSVFTLHSPIGVFALRKRINAVGGGRISPNSISLEYIQNREREIFQWLEVFSANLSALRGTLVIKALGTNCGGRILVTYEAKERNDRIMTATEALGWMLSEACFNRNTDDFIIITTILAVCTYLINNESLYPIKRNDNNREIYIHNVYDARGRYREALGFSILAAQDYAVVRKMAEEIRRYR